MHLSPVLDNINRHCEKLMRFALNQGFFHNIQADVYGEIRVNIPFCGSLSEAPGLTTFMLEEILPRVPAAQRVRCYCSDVRCCGTQAMTAMKSDPRVVFEVEEKDLSSATLPPAEFTLGFHPQPLTKTPDRLWERIIQNVLRSSKKCLFTCWMKSEAEELVRICRSLGSTCTMQRNPCPLPEGVSVSMEETASMRFHFIVMTNQ